ncbi:hypothetical protein pipiens_000695, partial [Culex pipiens pipiens]
RNLCRGVNGITRLPVAKPEEHLIISYWAEEDDRP